MRSISAILITTVYLFAIMLLHYVAMSCATHDADDSMLIAANVSSMLK